ncbi:DAK2 domain-containing protein [Streptomyces decoyicus]|uniref:DAK2 domain-containing protein n=1 Tax=Streptomyces decoyicus TaxID=249567 RepID=UPI0036292F75
MPRKRLTTAGPTKAAPPAPRLRSAIAPPLFSGARAGTRAGGEDLLATKALQAALDVVAADEDGQGRLDAVAGDGDHGIGIVRGLRAAVAAEPGPAGDPHSAGAALLTAGLALADASGGASGALYGALPAETGAVLTKAPAGEKTMLDALDPFRRELRARAGEALPTAWQAAAEAATRAAAGTAQLVPARGRAARMGVRGHGHPDAGAVSLALVLTAAGATLR